MTATGMITESAEWASEATAEPASLDDRIAAACGHLNACYAELVALVREVIATEAWRGFGIRSLEHWITWRTGLSASHANTLVALAGADDAHPKVSESLTAGELSIDQAALAIKARPEHDDDIAEFARVMTLSQLRVAVRASIASTPSPAPKPDPGADDAADDEPASCNDDSARTEREHFSLRPDEDGTWPLFGRLDPDHGAILDAALAEARDRLFREGRRDVTWVDALIDIAERSLDAVPDERGERFRVNVFLDPEHSPTATWINGIAVPDAIKRLFTCDGSISPVFVSNAKPVSVGRTQRIVPERTRRIVLQRDKKCRSPMCSATRGLEVHHIVHWLDGDGPSDTWNLIALCSQCHRDHHLGRLDINGDADEPGGVVFRDEHGRVIDPATHAAKPPGPPPDPLRPYRHPLGERLQRWAILFNPPRPPGVN